MLMLRMCHHKVAVTLYRAFLAFFKNRFNIYRDTFVEITDSESDRFNEVSLKFVPDNEDKLQFLKRDL